MGEGGGGGRGGRGESGGARGQRTHHRRLARVCVTAKAQPENNRLRWKTSFIAWVWIQYTRVLLIRAVVVSALARIAVVI